MKYIYLLTAILFIGCSDKSVTLKKPVASKVEIVQVANVVEVKKEVVKQEVVVKQEIVKNEVLVEEPKVMKNVGSDVPTSCVMWSDGSNICNRVAKGKASCTTNPVSQRMFSCLQWQ